jgi:tRNA-Thr(GGU) m(6)t(6)A37 methyltransferase TsaA
MSTYQIHSIGHVQQAEDGFLLVIDEAYRAGLKQLDQFSHVIVYWWAAQHDNADDRAKLQTTLPYAPGVTAGVFACRAPYRPNPIAMTICPMFGVDERAGTILVAWIDAFDGTPIIDLKPYIPMSERVRDVDVPVWLKRFPSYMEDAATFDFSGTGLGDS